jgi:hypothetical protein
MENAMFRDVASHTTWPNPNDGGLEERANPIVFPSRNHSGYREGGLLAEQYISLDEDGSDSSKKLGDSNWQTKARSSSTKLKTSRSNCNQSFSESCRSGSSSVWAAPGLNESEAKDLLSVASSRAVPFRNRVSRCSEVQCDPSAAR